MMGFYTAIGAITVLIIGGLLIDGDDIDMIYAGISLIPVLGLAGSQSTE